MSLLDKTVQELGEGSFGKLESGYTIFKMSSYENNPVIKPQDIGLVWEKSGELKIGAVFNGGAELYNNKVFLMPRCHKNYHKKTFFDDKLGKERECLDNYISEIWTLASEDGINFRSYKNSKILGDGTAHQDFKYGIEDIRVIKYKEYYFLIGCGKLKQPFKGSNADRIAIYTTRDFENITYHGIVDSFDSRNAVAFPEEINGKYYMLFRFYPNIHIEYLEGGIDQLLNPAKYNKEWKNIYDNSDKSLLIEVGHLPHEMEKVGPSTQPIKTKNGWLVIYPAVGNIGKDICKLYGVEGKIERGYSINAAILDLDDPRKVLCRTKYPIYIPSFPYELYGNDEYPIDVPAVVFPVGAFVKNNKLLIYAGAGDKYTILLSCKLDTLLHYMLKV